MRGCLRRRLVGMPRVLENGFISIAVASCRVPCEKNSHSTFATKDSFKKGGAFQANIKGGIIGGIGDLETRGTPNPRKRGVSESS